MRTIPEGIFEAVADKCGYTSLHGMMDSYVNLEDIKVVISVPVLHVCLELIMDEEYFL